MAIVWHLDVVRDGDAAPLLVVWEPHSGVVECEPMRHFVRLEVLHALRMIWRRMATDWPDEIVTDNSPQWFGVADAVGASRRFVVAGQMTELERIARGLIEKLGADE